MSDLYNRGEVTESSLRSFLDRKVSSGIRSGFVKAFGQEFEGRSHVDKEDFLDWAEKLCRDGKRDVILKREAQAAYDALTS